MRYWIKLYTEILSDPKMGRLTDRQFRTCINLFALAGETDNGGHLPPLEDIAWHLRRSVDDLTADLEALTKVEIVAQDNGCWRVRKWQDRQAKAPSAERAEVLQRVQAHRARKRNEDVTTLQGAMKRVVTPPETETETDIDSDVEKKRKDSDTDQNGAPVGVCGLDPAYERAISLFENEISLISGSIAPDMADMWDLLTANGVPGWWDTAIAIAVAANKRSWSYMRGILQNCLTRGEAPVLRLSTNGNGSAHAAPAKPPPKYAYVDDVDAAGRPIKRRVEVSA